MNTSFGVAYGEHDRSLPQKGFMTVLHGAGLSLTFWVLFGEGMKQVNSLLGTGFHPGNAGRNYLVAAGLAVYFLRVLLTSFYLLKRKMTLQEAFTIGIWTIVIDVVFALLGGSQAGPLGGWAYLGVGLYVLGSVFNTGSEWMRDRWKRVPENRGKLYTTGFFRFTRHPNYFGDTLLFTGLVLMAGNAWLITVPLFMAASFVFVNIPALDGYLADRYGEQFDAYARQTKKFIPFVY